MSNSSAAPAIMEGAVIEVLRRQAGIRLDPHLANASLIYDEAGSAALAHIQARYLRIAESCGLHFVVMTPTWRAQHDRIAHSDFAAHNVIGDAVRFVRELTAGSSVPVQLLSLKHVRNCSYDVLEREVRVSFAYRDFARIALGQVTDAVTWLGSPRPGRRGDCRGDIQGRRLRVGATVVETSMHYPTDSSLLGHGAQVLTRTMKKIEQRAGGKLQRKVRDRMRSVNKRVVATATASRHRGPEGKQKAKDGTA